MSEPVMKMKLEVTGEGAKAISPFAPKKNYAIWFNAFAKGRRTEGHVEFSFVTNPTGDRKSAFSGYIEPEHFEDLALLMLKAHPQAAIKAFGAALQHVGRIGEA